MVCMVCVGYSFCIYLRGFVDCQQNNTVEQSLGVVRGGGVLSTCQVGLGSRRQGTSHGRGQVTFPILVQFKESCCTGSL
jgi:hypothetical protein